MWFSVLGPLEVRDGDALVPLGGSRQRAVLALLLLAAPRLVPGDRVITEIWGVDPPDGARDSLYTYVSNLRGAIERDRIVRADGGYRLVLRDDDAIDAARFESQLVEARRAMGADADRAVVLVTRAMALWRGQPYQGLDLPSAAPESARLTEIRLRGLEDRAEAELRAGRVPEVGEVQMLTVEQPYRERFWELLARALYRAGRQAEALAALAQLRRTLADDLGIEPAAAIARLEERILVQDPTLDATGPGPGTNVPVPLSSFVGRTAELEALESRVVHDRLVTLAGSGGAGKTRLAIELCGRLAGGFADGVWLADLARLPGPDGVAEAVAAAVGVAGLPSADASLVDWARSRRALLVLDNCEHVIGPVAEVASRLLSTSPGLRVLATSRRPLDVPGEVVVALEGLGTALAGEPPGEAEQLFCARATAVRPDFVLDGENGAAVTEVCRHLDGLPLAIELAAARCDALSPQEIAGHLADRFRLLRTPHPQRDVHASLRASLDWSLDLLTPDQRRAFDLLGVFDGPFTAESAAAVLQVPPLEVTELLRGLVDASLLSAQPGPVSSYRMLETVRLFARRRLRGGNDEPEAVRRHDTHLLEICRHLRDDVFGRGRIAARDTVEAERADHEAAFDRWLVTGHHEEALEMASVLGHVWLFSGALRAGLDRLERVLAASAGAATRARADGLAVGAFLLMYLQRYADGIAWVDEATTIYRSVGDERGLAYALARRGHLAFSVGEIPHAVELLQESLETCGRIGSHDGTAWPLTLLAQARLWGGDESAEVRDMLAEGRRRFIEMGDTYGQVHATTFLASLQEDADRLRWFTEAVTLANQPGADPLVRPLALHDLAFAVWNAGEPERADGLNRLSARSALEMGVTVSSGMAFLQAAHFAGVAGQAERAAVLRGAGETHFTMKMAPFWDRQIKPGVDAAAAELGAERFATLRADGRAMTIDEATAFLLAERGPQAAGPSR